MRERATVHFLAKSTRAWVVHIDLLALIIGPLPVGRFGAGRLVQNVNLRVEVCLALAVRYFHLLLMSGAVGAALGHGQGQLVPRDLFHELA